MRVKFASPVKSVVCGNIRSWFERSGELWTPKESTSGVFQSAVNQSLRARYSLLTRSDRWFCLKYWVTHWHWDLPVRPVWNYRRQLSQWVMAWFARGIDAPIDSFTWPGVVVLPMGMRTPVFLPPGDCRPHVLVVWHAAMKLGGPKARAFHGLICFSEADEAETNIMRRWVSQRLKRSWTDGLLWVSAGRFQSMNLSSSHLYQ